MFLNSADYMHIFFIFTIKTWNFFNGIFKHRFDIVTTAQKLTLPVPPAASDMTVCKQIQVETKG